jgi:hypothetical protein
LLQIVNESEMQAVANADALVDSRRRLLRLDLQLQLNPMSTYFRGRLSGGTIPFMRRYSMICP